MEDYSEYSDSEDSDDPRESRRRNVHVRPPRPTPFFGLMDNRLGPLDENHPCRTCGGDLNSCEGHWGHIDLPFPVYHSGNVTIFVRRKDIALILNPLPGLLDKVQQVLESVCINCGNLRLSLVRRIIPFRLSLILNVA